MRRKILLVVAMSALALGGGVATADTAEARRNVGGSLPFGATCEQPGAVVFEGDLATRVPCICISTEHGLFPYVAGSENCPRGAQLVRIARNVGG